MDNRHDPIGPIGSFTGFICESWLFLQESYFLFTFIKQLLEGVMQLFISLSQKLCSTLMTLLVNSSINLHSETMDYTRSVFFPKTFLAFEIRTSSSIIPQKSVALVMAILVYPAL